MTDSERLLEITKKFADKKQEERVEKERVNTKYKNLDKKKKLTLEQRIERLEELL